MYFMSIRFKYNICPLPEFQHVQSYGMPKTIAFLSLVMRLPLYGKMCVYSILSVYRPSRYLTVV